jgi:hypothetical protein
MTRSQFNGAKKSLENMAKFKYLGTIVRKIAFMNKLGD